MLTAEEFLKFTKDEGRNSGAISFSHSKRKMAIENKGKVKVKNEEIYLDRSEAPKEGLVTPRAVIIGIISLIFYIIIDLRAWLLNIGMSPGAFTFPSSAGLLFVMIMLIVGFALWKTKWRFSHGEIITVYAMVMFGGVVHGSFRHVIPNIMAPRYWYSTQKQVDTMVNTYNLIKPSIIPQGQDVFDGFFNGGMSVPWGAWIGPILLVTIALLVLLFTAMCMGVLLHRQWDEVEHFRYPLSTPILQLTEQPEDKPLSDFWRNPLVWIGMIIPYT